MSPTRLKRNVPRNVPSAFWLVPSEIRSSVARGVTVCVAEDRALTMTPTAKVVTASIEPVSTLRIVSTALAPITSWSW